MIKKIKTAILILIHFLFLQVAFGQTQSVNTDYLRKKFLNYCKTVPREEIYIHTDRHEYISGEEMWFNIYLIDRQTSKPSLNNKIVYFELLNNENRPVVQKRILIDKGFGPGQVVLPDTLSTGAYTVRAYTSWMKNFLPENCFTYVITVYNALKSNGFKGIQNEVSAKKETYRSGEVSLKIDKSQPQALSLEVNTNDKFRTENNLFYVFIQTSGNINHVSAEKISGLNTGIDIPVSELSAGINQVTIFNSKGEPVAEKYTYTARKENTPMVVDAIDSCGLRDKISLDILINPRFTMNASNLSISVAPVSENSAEADIADYMVFGSEYGIDPLLILKGRKVSELKGELDSLLQHIHSSWIDWPVVLSDKAPKFRYQPEKEDHFLSGKLLTGSQPAGAGNLLLMSSPGKQAGFQYARTDDDGNFSFRIHIDEEQKDLIIQPDEVTSNHKIIMEPSFSDKYMKTVVTADSSGEVSPKAVTRLSVNHQVQKIYGVSSPGGPVNYAVKPDKPVRFYGKPDIELFLADYIRLPVMSEVFFELLPGVALKKKKSSAEISITYHIGDEQFTTIPALMIDGVVIKDPLLIANLDPDVVEKIDVIREKYEVGKYYFPGLINVITKTADFNSVSLPDYMMRLPYKVIDRVFTFSSPDYSVDSTRESRIPDYRNTLYWNPSARPDAGGKVGVSFWSSDNKADYLLDIQGITGDGKFFSFRKIVKVK